MTEDKEMGKLERTRDWTLGLMASGVLLIAFGSIYELYKMFNNPKDIFNLVAAVTLGGGLTIFTIECLRNWYIQSLISNRLKVQTNSI